MEAQDLLQSFRLGFEESLELGSLQLDLAFWRRLARERKEH
jgi:hypothetical protein